VLVSAAVCPHPPLIVPEVAGRDAGDLTTLRGACLDAVDLLRAADPDLLVVVGTGATPATFDAGARGSFARYGADVSVSLPGAGPTDGTDLPLSLSVGAWLLGRDAWTSPVSGVAVSWEAPVAERAEIGARLADQADRVALLAMADLSAHREKSPPGHADPRAGDFDAAVVAAVRDGDPAALYALDTDLGRTLEAEGVPALQVLAGAAGDAVYDADILYDDAPYGVGYVVAVWERHG
jgi:hypothetical protein